jgi:hypothetical protein
MVTIGKLLAVSFALIGWDLCLCNVNAGSTSFSSGWITGCDGEVVYAAGTHTWASSFQIVLVYFILFKICFFLDLLFLIFLLLYIFQATGDALLHVYCSTRGESIIEISILQVIRISGTDTYVKFTNITFNINTRSGNTGYYFGSFY